MACQSSYMTTLISIFKKYLNNNRMNSRQQILDWVCFLMSNCCGNILDISLASKAGPFFPLGLESRTGVSSSLSIGKGDGVQDESRIWLSRMNGISPAVIFSAVVSCLNPPSLITCVPWIKSRVLGYFVNTSSLLGLSCNKIFSTTVMMLESVNIMSYLQGFLYAWHYKNNKR